jgi:hypothetical protein
MRSNFPKLWAMPRNAPGGSEASSLQKRTVRGMVSLLNAAVLTFVVKRAKGCGVKRFIRASFSSFVSPAIRTLRTKSSFTGTLLSGEALAAPIIGWATSGGTTSNCARTITKASEAWQYCREPALPRLGEGKGYNPFRSTLGMVNFASMKSEWLTFKYLAICRISSISWYDVFSDALAI